MLKRINCGPVIVSGMFSKIHATFIAVSDTSDWWGRGGPGKES